MEDTPVLQQGEVVIAEGKYPSQVVLREVKPGTYATHIKVLPPGAEPYFILGHYFFNLKDAQSDLQKRIKEMALL